MPIARTQGFVRNLLLDINEDNIDKRGFRKESAIKVETERLRAAFLFLVLNN